MEGYCAKSLQSLASDIAGLDKQIAGLVAWDAHLEALYKVVKSVRGIGKRTALELIVVSNEFKGIKTAKSCAW